MSTSPEDRAACKPGMASDGTGVGKCRLGSSKEQASGQGIHSFVLPTLPCPAGRRLAFTAMKPLCLPMSLTMPTPRYALVASTCSTGGV